MFSIESAKPTSCKMDMRKELRMRREDEALVKLAASAEGLHVDDFIRRAAILRARDVQRRMSHSVLPVETFKEFNAAVEAPGKTVPGLARAFEASEGLLKHVG